MYFYKYKFVVCKEMYSFVLEECEQTQRHPVVKADDVQPPPRENNIH